MLKAWSCPGIAPDRSAGSLFCRPGPRGIWLRRRPGRNSRRLILNGRLRRTNGGIRGDEADRPARRSEDERGWSAIHAQREAYAISVRGSKSTITGAKAERHLHSAAGPDRIKAFRRKTESNMFWNKGFPEGKTSTARAMTSAGEPPSGARTLLGHTDSQSGRSLPLVGPPRGETARSPSILRFSRLCPGKHPLEVVSIMD